jgi:glycosyltransferase involved in cell wall biosynthesis
MLDQVEHKQLVYDCVDEHSEYTGLINKQVMLDMERDLLYRCDFVFVTAIGLYNTKKDFARRIYFLPNAANVDHFMQAQDEETIVPPDIASIKGPVIGFVGVIQDWIDLDLIFLVAKSYPDWSVVLIGPVGVGIDISVLRSLPNVHLLGRKEVRDLPRYIKAFDVCLNPFKLNELTDKVSPLKFYEYLASGKPIVTVNMPGVRDFADVVEIADTPDEFVTAVGKAVNDENPAKLAARLARAKENSWESRVEFMMQKIKEEY